MKSIIASFFIFYAVVAPAHELSTSYVDAILQSDGRVAGTLTLKVMELKDIVNLDTNLDGELTWGELTHSAAKIEEVIVNGFSLTRGSTNCALVISDKFSLKDMSSDTYVLVPFDAQCNLAGSLTINYNLFFDVSSTHKSILNLRASNNNHLLVFTHSNNSISLDVEDGSKIQTFSSFVYQGMFHIAIGFDHILFLLTLLLTVCLVRNQFGWKAISAKKDILKRTVWIVTSFTLAHSITLTGTTLGIIPSMGPWIEVIIAASILFNVINNLTPFLSKLAVITFIFGLVHGMGFAGALAELGLPMDQNWLAVAAFNIGVELGQLALLIVFLPFLIFFRTSLIYQKWIMPCMSLLIGGLSAYWIIDRLLV